MDVHDLTRQFTHARLEAHGIHGNGHLMALERNHAKIAGLISTWLSQATVSPSVG